MKKSSSNSVAVINQSNDRNDGSTAQRLNGSTVLNQSNDRNDGLTPSQERAIKALLASRSIAAAARQADVGESSLRRWLREDDNFQDKLRRLREQALSHAALQLQEGVSKAVGILYDLIEREKRVEPGRASLIRTALDYGFRSSIYNDVIERMKTLEEKQAAGLKQ